MKIVDVRTHKRRNPLPQPFVTAKRTVTSLDSLFVEIVDDNGVSGWGEVVPNLRDTGEFWEGLQPVVTGPLAQVCLGREAADFGSLCDGLGAVVGANHGARSAVDVALHDLRARQLGIPLRAMFGVSTDRVATDVSIPFGTIEEMSAWAVDFCAQGFRALKVKVGLPGRADIDVVREIAAAVPASTLIRLDANQGWSAKQAVAVMAELERADIDIEVLEQPVPARDVEGLRYVTERVRPEVIADESVASCDDVLELIRRQAVDGFMIKASKLGGLRAAQRAVALAEVAGKSCMISTILESPLGVTAAANLAVSAPSVIKYIDLDAAVWSGSKSVRGGMRYENGDVVLPASPGLGIEGLSDGGEVL